TAQNGTQNVQIAVTVLFGKPQVNLVSPNELAPGSTNQDITIAGLDLGGTSKIEFYLNGAPDPNVSASIVSTQSAAVSAKVTVSSAAQTGARVLVVTTPGGTSRSFATGANILKIATPSRTIDSGRRPIKRDAGPRGVIIR